MWDVAARAAYLEHEGKWLIFVSNVTSKWALAHIVISRILGKMGR